MTAYDISKSFEAIENELISSMIRNMQRHKAEEEKEDKRWAMWQAEQLKSLEKYRQDNRKKFNGRFQQINSKIAQLIRIAHSEGNMSQEEAILKAVKAGFPAKRIRKGASAEFFKLNDRKLEALIKATTDDMEKAETAVLRMADDQYRKIIFNAQMYANTGAGTYEKAVDMATKDFLAAGLNCVQYKNGARHTISDYADMAIRTASKRAYLQGEGMKRQEWGISTVIMNKRGNPCPLCLPFVGKVFIDDVWSNGPKDGKSPETGITYPLMSNAVAAGLYHPRCRDNHTTYFEGISTPPDAKYTREELADLDEENRKEAKRQYAIRQTEKFERMAKYSLDEDNKKEYEIKGKQWKTVEKQANFDIMESDLGAFKKRLRRDKNINDEYYDSLKEKFARGSTDAKAAFTKFVPMDSVEDSAYESIAKFNTKTKKISMHYGIDSINERGKGATWFHEHGHLIDDAAGKISDNEEFMNLLKKDAYNYRISYGKKYNLKTWDKVDAAISGELNEMRKHSSVADMMEGVTRGNIRGVAGHPDGYWSNEKNITAEAFAHMFEAEFDKERYAEMKKYFPESLKYFEKQLKEVLN